MMVKEVVRGWFPYFTCRVSVVVLLVEMIVPYRGAHAATLRSVIETSVLPLFSVAIGFIMTLSVLAFIVGIIRFMYTAGDDKSRSDGKQLMIWGTLALFIMVSLWGVVGILKATFFGN